MFGLRHTIILSLITLMFASCGSNMAIYFGSGGGFTGAVQEYVIESDGTLSQCKANCTEKLSLKQLKRSELKELHPRVKQYQLTELDYNQPYNMYKFLRITSEDGENSITWSDNEQNSTTKQLNKVYEWLMFHVGHID